MYTHYLKTFEDIFKKVLEPTLLELGFQNIVFQKDGFGHAFE